MAEDLLELGRAWQPQVVIRDPLEFGGYLAAEVWGRPHATVLWAFSISVRAAGGSGLGALRQRYGLPPDPGLDTLDRFLALKFLPDAWAFPNWPPPAVTHRFCAPPFDQDGEAELPPQPTLYATLTEPGPASSNGRSRRSPASRRR